MLNDENVAMDILKKYNLVDIYVKYCNMYGYRSAVEFLNELLPHLLRKGV